VAGCAILTLLDCCYDAKTSSVMFTLSASVAAAVDATKDIILAFVYVVDQAEVFLKANIPCRQFLSAFVHQQLCCFVSFGSNPYSRGVITPLCRIHVITLHHTCQYRFFIHPTK
jgi:hypothetical protein